MSDAPISGKWTAPRKAARQPGESRADHEIRTRSLSLKEPVKTLRQYIAAHRRKDSAGDPFPDDVDTEARDALAAIKSLLETFTLLKQVTAVDDIARLYAVVRTVFPDHVDYMAAVDRARLTYPELWGDSFDAKDVGVTGLPEIDLPEPESLARVDGILNQRSAAIETAAEAKAAKTASKKTG